jgi:Xaa-Pro aminopeptidase
MIELGAVEAPLVCVVQEPRVEPSFSGDRHVTFEPNRQALKALVEEQGLDTLIAMSPENFTYVSGVHILTVAAIRPRQGFAVIPAKGEPFLVICSIEKTLAEAESWVKDIDVYTEFVDNPIDALTASLRKRGLAGGTIGIDLDYLPANSFEHLKRNLHNVGLVDTSEKIAAIRAIKTPEEVAFMEKATKETHRAVLDAMAESRLGDTERTIANRIGTGIINNGAQGTLFLCFASGDRTPQPHAHATDRVPEPGEIIRFDVGGTYGAFNTDFARTYSTGSPSAMQREAHRGLCEAQEATIEAMRPGVAAEDLFYLCKDEFKKRGLAWRLPHIGHSFGMDLHESPLIRPGDKTKLKPGMVINIEPMTSDDGGSFYHTEDLVVITDTGYRLLTLGLAPKEIPVLGQKVA